MEQEQQTERLIKRYECKNCGSIFDIDIGQEHETIKCCKSPNHILLLHEEKGNEKLQLVDSYSKIIEVLKEYIDTSEENYKFVAVWIIGTYLHEKFSTYPYLFFNAMRGSGKTRILKLISSLGAKGNGSVENNLTEAVLFRILQGTTTCIDEFENIGNKNKQTLRELLNSAYKKGMVIKRMKKVNSREGEKFVVETFQPYFPIAMANIWGMEEVLSDRSITLILEKSDNPGITKMIEDFDTNDDILQIKHKLNELQCSLCSVVSQKNINKEWNNYIRNKYNTTLTTLYTYTTLHTLTTSQATIEFESLFNKIDNLGINGRNFELLFPLILVAQELDILDEFLIICKTLIDKKRADDYVEGTDINLYKFINSLNKADLNTFAFKPVKILTMGFRDYLDETDMEDKWLNERWMGRALKRLNLIVEKKRECKGIEVRLNFNKAKDKVEMFDKGEYNVTTN